MKDGLFVRPIDVKAGTSDGAYVAVSAEGLHEGQEVVIGEILSSTQSDVKNPFLPKVINLLTALRLDVEKERVIADAQFRSQDGFDACFACR